jgi:hypothetical protein
MKKLIVFALIFAVSLAFAVTAMAADIEYSRVGFHCGFDQGGPSMDKKLGYNGVDLLELRRATEFRWELVSKDFVCPNCGDNYWITYSDFDGVFDGKNIQMCHLKPDTPTPYCSVVVKKYLDGLNTNIPGFEFVLEKRVIVDDDLWYWEPIGDSVISTDSGVADFGNRIVEIGMYRIIEIHLDTNLYIDKKIEIQFQVQQSDLSNHTVFSGSDFIWDNITKPEPGRLLIGSSVTLTTITKTILQKWQREVTPYEEWTQYLSPAYSSVTATNADYVAKFDPKNNKFLPKESNVNIVANSDHFTYAKLAVADLVDGVDLALVVGNKIEQIGTARVKITDDGTLELTFDGDLHGYTFGAVAFTKILEPKNGNIHSDKVFNHNNIAVLDMPAADKDGFIYLYVHFANLQYKDGIPELTRKWTVEGPYELKFKKVVKVDKDTTEIYVTYIVKDVNGMIVDDSMPLAPGWYTVKFDDPKNNGNEFDPVKLEVLEGKYTTYIYTAEYNEKADPIIISKNLSDIINPVVIVNKTAVKK